MAGFKEYKPKSSGNQPRIAPMEQGYYGELLIQNHSNNNIVLIKSDNSKHVIPPLPYPTMSGAHVRIVKREHNGSRINGRTYDEVESPTKVYEIPIMDLESDPPYIPELGIMLCTEAQAVSTNHPSVEYETYTDALFRVTRELAECSDSVTIRVYANDPEGKITKLYWWFHSQMHEIHVTQSPADGATIMFSVSQERRITVQKLFPMATILEGEGKYETIHGEVLYIAETEDEVILALDQDKEMRKRESKSIEARLTERDKRHQENLKHINEEHAMALQEKDAKIRELNLTIKQRDHTISVQQGELDRWHSIGDYSKHVAGINKATAAAAAAEANADKARVSAMSDKLKLGVEILKIGIPLVTMLITIAVAKR
jgi:hypothetical protein